VATYYYCYRHQIINELKEEEKKGSSLGDKMTLYFRRPTEANVAAAPTSSKSTPAPTLPANNNSASLDRRKNPLPGALADEIGRRFSRELQERALPKSLVQHPQQQADDQQQPGVRNPVPNNPMPLTFTQ
jgi:hypothetical protein